MLSNLTGVHAVVILVIILFLFGAAKLPALAKSLGQSIKILKEETSSEGSASVEALPSTTTEEISSATTGQTPSRVTRIEKTRTR